MHTCVRKGKKRNLHLTAGYKTIKRLLVRIVDSVKELCRVLVREGSVNNFLKELEALSAEAKPLQLAESRNYLFTN